jgi:RHS repeat-associated protein
VYYYAGGKPIAMRVMPAGDNTGTLYYLHSDHLGSTSVTTCGSGACGTAGSVVARQWYYPYGAVRGSVGTLPTQRTFTGQYSDPTGLMYFNARYYSQTLGRFVSADTAVPDGDKASIVPLTVDFHEPQFLAQLNAENRYTLKHGFWFQLSVEEKREAKVQRGPLNPQALNRFSYVLGNPLKYTDPTGHDTWCNSDFTICSGGVVQNNSSHTILIKGDLLTIDGKLLQGYVFRLKPGQSSKELGIVDADQLIVDVDPINGHSGGEWLDVNDGQTVTVDDDASGNAFVEGTEAITVFGITVRRDPWNPPDGTSLIPDTTTGNGSRVLRTSFESPISRFGRVGRFPCDGQCITLTTLYVIKGR